MESSISQTPPTPPPPPPLQPEDPIRTIAMPLFQAKGWIRFLGVMSIIQAIVAIIGTMGIGIIWAWLPIWIGVILFQAAGAMEAAYNSGDRIQLIAANQKMKTYFIIQGVTMLVGIAIGIIAIFVVGTGAILGALTQF